MSNQVTVAPWYDTLQRFKEGVFSSLRVCLPGTVSAVHAENSTVDVTVGVLQNSAQQGLVGGLNFPYPQLLGCPLVTTQGGGVGAVMPVEIGDECLIVFSDRCIDEWFKTGQPTPLPNFRMHDIGDGFVIVGLNSLGNVMQTPLESNEGGICETQNPTGAAAVVNSATSLVSIRNGSQNLALILTNITTELLTLNGIIATMTTASIAAGTPQAAAAAQIAVITQQIANLAALLY